MTNTLTEDGAAYRVLSTEILGRTIGIKESGKKRTNRPVKTLELYEFEVSVYIYISIQARMCVLV